MRRVTWAAFVDELEKISTQARGDTEGPGESYYQSNSSSGATQEGNPGWEQKTVETPARRANNIFGISRVKNRRGLRRYDDQSEAKSDDASQGPIAGDTSNSVVTTSNAMSPQTGPGGV